MEDIKSIYINYKGNVPKLKGVRPDSDWVDVYACRVSINGKNVDFSKTDKLDYRKGDTVKVFLGFSLKLPKGFEAILSPRSSTFRKASLVQTNSIGVIDESYCGPDDEWAQEFYALRNGSIQKYQRLGQFRIQAKQPSFDFIEVDKVSEPNRGGYGSTGI